MHLTLFPTLMIDRVRLPSVALGDLTQPRDIGLQPVLPIYKSLRIHCAEPGVGKDTDGIYPIAEERAIFAAPAITLRGLLIINIQLLKYSTHQSILLMLYITSFFSIFTGNFDPFKPALASLKIKFSQCFQLVQLLQS